MNILIKSIAILKESKPNIKCLIIGDGPEKKQLEKKEQELLRKENELLKRENELLKKGQVLQQNNQKNQTIHTKADELYQNNTEKQK